MLVDLDEFIVPRHNWTWKDMLAATSCHNRKEAPVRNVYFHTELASDTAFERNKTLKGLGGEW